MGIEPLLRASLVNVVEEAMRQVRARDRPLPPATPPDNAADDLLTVDQSAAILKTTPPTVRGYLKSGALLGERPGNGRYWRIRRTVLDEFIAAGPRRLQVDAEAAAAAIAASLVTRTEKQKG